MTFQPTDAPPCTEPTKDGFGLLDGCVAVAESIKLLLLGPIFAGMLAYGIASILPKSFTSIAVLELNDESANAAEALLRSRAVLDRIVEKNPVAGIGHEDQLSILNRNIRLTPVAGQPRKTATLFDLEVDDSDPSSAQNKNTLLLDTWLEQTKPRAVARIFIEQQLEQTKTQRESIISLIVRLEREAPSLLSPNSAQGELASTIVRLIEKRDLYSESISRLENRLAGTARDVVVSPPSLPAGPKWLRKGLFAVSASLATGALLLVFVLLRHAARTPTPKILPSSPDSALPCCHGAGWDHSQPRSPYRRQRVLAVGFTR